MTTGHVVREPNLVIIGAQKAGTTSLYHYLKSHPEIFMSYPVKEPGYFMQSDFILRLFRRIDRPVASRAEALERYMLRGYGTERYFGEASTYYTIGIDSEVHGVPARMKRTEPAMKLIYIVRNPFDRIVSNYLHILHSELFSGDFQAFLESRHYERALLTSRYWYQLRAYLEHFPRRQIKAVVFEDLVRDAQSVVEEIHAFLEVTTGTEVSAKAHNRSENRSSFDAGDLLFPASVYREALRVMKPEVRKLERFIGRKLDVWDMSMERWCGGAIS